MDQIQQQQYKREAIYPPSDYSRGSRFGKIIAYGIGAKLTILAGFVFYIMANLKKKTELSQSSVFMSI